MSNNRKSEYWSGFKAIMGIIPFFAGIMPLYYVLYFLHESRERRKLDRYDNVTLCSCLCKKHYDSSVM
jgi:hypothetical protein